NSRRQSTITYSVLDGEGNSVQVCRQTFIDIFAISRSTFQTLATRKKNGEIVFEEKKGKGYLQCKIKSWTSPKSRRGRDCARSQSEEETWKSNLCCTDSECVIFHINRSFMLDKWNNFKMIERKIESRTILQDFKKRLKQYRLSDPKILKDMITHLCINA
ncbi:hypothetical protein L9F63_005181, partial [Diploptera punctata]